MNGGFSPIVIVQAMVRNIVPLVGILAFHWSAGNVLILYFIDTMLTISVLIAGLMSKFAPAPDDDGVAGWINAQAGYVAAALFFSAFAAIPLGAPVGIMLSVSDFSFRDALNDHSLRVGVLVQSVVALWSYIGLYRALRTHTPEELHLRPRFALVFMRWVVVIMATYFILDILPPSEPVLLLLVVAYIGGSIFAEISPDRFLKAMPGGESNLCEDATSDSPGNPRTTRDRLRRGKR